jgi:hypothetical protein
MKEFPTQQILELACAAQRTNGSYIKEHEHIFAEDGKFMYTKHANKMLMLCTVDHKHWTADPKDAPMPLRVLAEDTVRAEEIKTYYKRLLFAAIDGENEFLTKINSLLSGNIVKENEFGWMACLPSVQARDVAQTKIKKAARQVEEGYLGKPGDRLVDLDCEIIEVIKSKNFTGWNICAIINNRMASWMSQVELKQGPCVIVKAKVKDNSKHWKHGNDETRLNFVKAAQ